MITGQVREGYEVIVCKTHNCGIPSWDVEGYFRLENREKLDIFMKAKKAEAEKFNKEHKEASENEKPLDVYELEYSVGKILYAELSDGRILKICGDKANSPSISFTV